MKKLYKNEDAIIFDNVFCDFSTGQLLEPIETQNYVIVQITESYYRNSFQIGTHTQYCDLEITFPLTNGMSCATNDLWTCISRHECYLSFRGEDHALIGPKGSRFQTLAVNLRDGPCCSMLEQIKQKTLDHRTCCMPDLAALLSSIIAEFMAADILFSNNSLDSLITAILVRLARIGTHIPSPNLISTEEKLPAIMNYLDSNFLQIRSLEELSVHFGYTYGHICKAFKKVYGMTPGEYLLSKKLEYAQILHREGKNLSQIAELLGYSNSYNLSRAFKNFYGVSPEAYWKNNP